MTALELVVIALAGWRMAYAATKEDGPFAVFKRARTRFPLGGLLSCLYCASVWTAALSWLILQTPAAPLVYILAGSALGIWGHRWIGFD